MSQLHLEGIKVVDLSRLLPGPMCTLFLADLGADVIKVEDTRGGDYARYYPPIVAEYGAFFASLNRNKRSLTLDLKAERGPEILKAIVRDADVVVESFRPGVMDRLGVGYDVLREVNPGLVYCAISGFGQTGPDARRAGHDLGYMARTGLLEQQGKQGGPVVTPGFQVADIAGGALFGALGILAALVGRQRTGEGSFVDISLTEGALALAMPAIANLSAGEPQVRGANMLTGGLPCYDVYETADGRFLAVAPLEPKFWTGFVEAIERPDLIADGLSGDPSIKAEISAEIRRKSLAAWTEIFAAIDVCCEPVQTFEETLVDAQHQARKMFFTLAGVQHIRTPVTPIEREHTPAPAQGADTDAVLREAGFVEGEIDALRSSATV